MNLGDVAAIARIGQEANQAIDKHGISLFRATKDWQSPLRSGGAPGCKNEHSDPTGTTVVNPDPLALEHDQLVANLRAYMRAAANLRDQLLRLAPVSPASITRGRVNTVPACLVCAGPAPQPRRGMCEADYRAWLRADRPDLEGFKRQRQREAVAAARVIHEHEVA